MHEEIVALARTLGRVSNHEEGLLEPLCQAAQAELKRSLRPGVDLEQCREIFCTAAAWLALAGLEAGRQVGQAASFSAGDLTIKAGDAGSKAASLRREARRLMAPWLRDDAFFFMGVKSL